MPSFTKIFQLHEPVQFTPCVERTTLSYCQRLRKISSESLGSGLSSVKPSLIISPRFKCFNFWNSLLSFPAIRTTTFFQCCKRIKPFSNNAETAFTLFKLLQEYLEAWCICCD